MCKVNDRLFHIFYNHIREHCLGLWLCRKQFYHLLFWEMVFLPDWLGLWKLFLGLFYGSITLNIKFHEIPCISSWATIATKFLSQTDRHFPEIVQSCSGYSKTRKSIKNRKSKIFMKPVLSSIYIEGSKNTAIHFASLWLLGKMTFFVSRDRI